MPSDLSNPIPLFYPHFSRSPFFPFFILHGNTCVFPFFMAAAGSPSPAAAVVSLAPCFSVYCRIALLPLLFPAWSSCSSLCLILCGFWG